jgi:hypothetical protein
MARYSNFLHRKVEVLYRAGDIILPASGVLVADSGRSIFLEQHFEQRGQIRNFRWEIPYQYIVRLKDSVEASSTPPQESRAPAEKQMNAVSERVSQDDPEKSRARAASALGGTASFLNPANHPKTV